MGRGGTPHSHHARSGGDCHVFDLTTLGVLVLLAVQRLGRLAYGIAIAEMVGLHACGVGRDRVIGMLHDFRESGMLVASDVPGRGGRRKLLYTLTERAQRAVDRTLAAEAELIEGTR